MADGPPDEFDYTPSYEINTDDGWLRDGNGNTVMGEGIGGGDGVDVNLDGLQGFSVRLNQVHQNFNSMASTLISPLQEMAMGAFGTAGQGLPWAQAMAALVGHNMQMLSEFNQKISIGVMNVASAAQTVHNVYGNTDAESAATINAVNFAFGDKAAAPDSVPQYVLDEMPTWNEFQAQNPGVAASMGPGVVPTGERVTVGDTTTTTVRIPQAGGPPIEMVTTQRQWSVPVGQSGVVTTVTMNGKVQTVTNTVSNGYSTTTRVTTSYYDKDGKHQRDRVTSESTETWDVLNSGAQTTQVNTTSTTTHTYDEKGERTDSTTTESSLAVGAERPDVPLPDARDDPLYKEHEERMRRITQPG